MGHRAEQEAIAEGVPPLEIVAQYRKVATCAAGVGAGNPGPTGRRQARDATHLTCPALPDKLTVVVHAQAIPIGQLGNHVGSRSGMLLLYLTLR